MSEETYLWYIDTAFLRPVPQHGMTIELVILKEVETDKWELEKVIDRQCYEGWRRTLFTFAITSGKKAAQFRIRYPQIQLDFAMKLTFIRSIGTYKKEGGSLYINPTWSKSQLFEISEDGADITVGNIVPSIIEPSAPPPEKTIELSINDPASLSILKLIWDIPSSLEGAIKGIGDRIGDLAGLGFGIVSGFFSTLFSSLPELFKRSSEESLKLVADLESEMAKGTTPEMKALLASNKALLQKIGAIGNPEPVEVELYEAGITPEGAWKEVERLGLGAQTMYHLLWASHMLMEAGTLGQVEAIGQYDNMISSKTASPLMMQTYFELPYKLGVLPFAERYFLRKHMPLMPPYSDLINMRVKDKITTKEFTEYLLDQGYAPKWAELIWDSHFQPPNNTDFIRNYWRGKFDKEQLFEYLKLVDYDVDTFRDIWEELLKEIPPYSELVNERVKEVLTEEQFLEFLQYYGFDKEWAGRIWDAHFAPASFVDFLTAMRRKDTVSIPIAGAEPITHTFGEDAARDMEVIKQLSILADYDPRYWDFFKTRMYNDPSPRMARWGFEVGALKDTDVADVVHRFGYRPDDEKWMTAMLLGFQERGWVTKYLTACSTAYIGGVISEEELKKRVVDVAGRNLAVADWIVKISDVRKEILAAGKVGRPKLLTLGDLKKAFLRDKITEDVLRTELMARGFEIGDVDILVSLLAEEKVAKEAGGPTRALTITQLIQAWRYGEITEDALRIDLQLRGLSPDETDILINTKKKQWGMGKPSENEEPKVPPEEFERL